MRALECLRLSDRVAPDAQTRASASSVLPPEGCRPFPLSSRSGAVEPATELSLGGGLIPARGEKTSQAMPRVLLEAKTIKNFSKPRTKFSLQADEDRLRKRDQERNDHAQEVQLLHAGDQLLLRHPPTPLHVQASQDVRQMHGREGAGREQAPVGAGTSKLSKKVYSRLGCSLPRHLGCVFWSDICSSLLRHGLRLLESVTKFHNMSTFHPVA